MKIGDYLDLEKEKSYLCSDGSITHTVNVDVLIQAVRVETFKEVADWMAENITWDWPNDELLFSSWLKERGL